MEYFVNAGGCVENVGHPLLDRLKERPTKQQARKMMGLSEDEILVALLPASRLQELRLVWPVIAGAAQILRKKIKLSDRTGQTVRFVVPVAENGLLGGIRARIEDSGLSDVTLLWQGDSHTAIAASDLAVTKSGSVTVELGLLNVPQIVVYRIGAVSAFLARRVFGFSLPYVSLVNLILEEQVVPEFIQEEATMEAVAEAAYDILFGGSHKEERMREGYMRLQKALGEPGASRRAAKHVLKSVGIGQTATENARNA